MTLLKISKYTVNILSSAHDSLINEFDDNDNDDDNYDDDDAHDL